MKIWEWGVNVLSICLSTWDFGYGFDCCSGCLLS